MDQTVALDKEHYEAVVAGARALGQTPEQFLYALIDAQTRTFDEILAPVRKGFESTSDEQLEELFRRAQKAARQ